MMKLLKRDELNSCCCVLYRMVLQIIESEAVTWSGFDLLIDHTTIEQLILQKDMMALERLCIHSLWEVNLIYLLKYHKLCYFFLTNYSNFAECRRCLLRKSPTNNRAPLVNIIKTYPLELVCMDYLTLKPSKGVGNVLVINDHLTK